METLQSTIFIEFDVNTKKITFLRGDNIIDYDSNATSIYVRVKYKNLSGNTVYLTPSELEDYKFSLYTIKPATNNVNLILGKVTDELKQNVYGGVVKFEIPRACTNRLGIVKCEIHINQGNKIIASSTFVLDVKQSLVTAFDDELLEDEDFPVLKQLILEIQKASNIDDNTPSLVTTYSSAKIEYIKRDLNLQIKEKADKTELDVERKRIDSFTRLAEGSTTGDAELIDGRIGCNGVTYDNVGDSIRGQMKDIIKTLNSVSSEFLLSVPTLEMGNIVISDTWVYKNSTTRVRTPEGYTIEIEKDSKINVDSSLLVFLGWINTKGNYRFKQWFSGEFIVEETGEYIVLARWQTEDTISPSDVIGLITIENKQSQININKENIENLQSQINTNKNDIENLQSQINMNKNDIDLLNSNPFVRSIAHQGYSVTSSTYGNSRLSSYVGAKEKGFDYGECDIQFTIDNKAVCCHDPQFNDGSETIVIAEHTIDELKEHSYYGETIASLDEVLKLCKTIGLKLYIDKFNNADTEEKRNNVFNSIQKYSMQDNIQFLVSERSCLEAINSWYDKASIGICYSPYGDWMIDSAKKFYTGKNYVSIVCNYENTLDIETLYTKIPPYVNIELWTIDNIDDYKLYAPYVKGIISNKYTFNDVNP